MKPILIHILLPLVCVLTLVGCVVTPLALVPGVISAQGASPTPTSDPLDPYARQLTPTPQPPNTPPHVGVQVGHWKTNELPDELARFRTSTGARYGSLTEAALNLSIGQRVVALLQAEGVVADLLPATMPISYTADAVVALHADGSRSTAARGYKLATPWRTSRASQHLLDSLSDEYRAVGFPKDGSITSNMRGYYAFSYRRFRHASARTTPAVILEMGFLTNATDRSVMTGQPDRIAQAIANGILRYLRERDPNDGQALLPPEYPIVRPQDGGVTVRATPSDQGRPIAEVDANRRLMIVATRDNWLQVFVRGQGTTIGWVRRDQVVATAEDVPPPTSGDS